MISVGISFFASNFPNKNRNRLIFFPEEAHTYAAKAGNFSAACGDFFGFWRQNLAKFETSFLYVK